MTAAAFLRQLQGHEMMMAMVRDGRRLVTASLLAALLAGCGGGGGGGDGESGFLEEAGSAILDFLSDGAFSDVDSLVAALQGDQLVVQDFGDSVLGTNPGVLPTGGALIDDINCGADSCTGQVLVPQINNGVLESFTRESGTIRRDGDNGFVVSSPSLGTQTFTKYVPPQNPPATGGGATATLDKTASCSRWWEAVGNRTWTFVSVREDTFVPDVAGATLAFTGQYNDVSTARTWQINGGSPDFMTVRSGTQVNLDDDWGTQQLCRFYLIYPNSAGGGKVIWAHSLSGGQLRFVLNPDAAVTQNEWILRAN